MCSGLAGRWPSADQLIGATAEQACLFINSLANFHTPYFDRIHEAASMGVAGWAVKLDDDDIDVNDLLAKTFKKGISFDQQAEGSTQVERAARGGGRAIPLDA